MTSNKRLSDLDRLERAHDEADKYQIRALNAEAEVSRLREELSEAQLNIRRLQVTVSAQAEVCGKRCDHGSECLRQPHEDGRHETQHGCVFFDASPTGASGMDAADGGVESGLKYVHNGNWPEQARDKLARVEVLPRLWRRRSDEEYDQVARNVERELAEELEEALRGES
jgi:hypothetical protein